MIINGPGFSNGVIIVDEPKSVYYPGQLISGNVHFEIDKPLTYTAISVVYVGEASVKWSEGQHEMYNGETRYKEVIYGGEEQYFHFKQCVGGGQGISTLPPGVHSIPFQFELPFNIPSSFKSEKGNVVYHITAYLESPDVGSKEKLVKEIQVVAPISKECAESMKQPLELYMADVQNCGCFCQSNKSAIKIVLPSGVFNVGSSIPVTVKVQSQSSVGTFDITFKIAMRLTYRTQHPRSQLDIDRDLVVMTKGPLASPARRDYTWDLGLPDTVLPNLEKCSVMDVAFFFKVKIWTSGCTDDVEDESQIFIGLLPSAEPAELSSLGALVGDLPQAPIPNPDNPPAFAPDGLHGAVGSLNAPTVSPSYTPNQSMPVTPNFRPAVNTDLYSPSAPEMKPTYELGFKL